MFQTTILSVQVIYEIDNLLKCGPIYVCTGDPVDPIQSRCDPCYSQPCQNGGMCISSMKMISTSSSFVSIASDEQFVCECSSLYDGDRCQVKKKHNNLGLKTTIVFEECDWCLFWQPVPEWRILLRAEHRSADVISTWRDYCCDGCVVGVAVWLAGREGCVRWVLMTVWTTGAGMGQLVLTGRGSGRVMMIMSYLFQSWSLWVPV